MRKPSLRLLSAAVAAGFAFCFASITRAQDYPAKPVKMLIAFALGGPSDIVGRLIAQKLTENFGNKPFLVENRPGAGGNIGIAQVAKSAPDGDTLLLVSSAFVINPSLYANAGFDALKDFTPVTLAVTSSVRAGAMPEIPTVAEAAIPDFEGDTLQLVMAPSGTPAAIVGRLQAEIARRLNAPELRERLVAMGFIIVASTPEQTGVKVRTELDMWARVVKAGNIKPE